MNSVFTDKLLIKHQFRLKISGIYRTLIVRWHCSYLHLPLQEQEELRRVPSLPPPTPAARCATGGGGCGGGDDKFGSPLRFSGGRVADEGGSGWGNGGNIAGPISSLSADDLLSDLRYHLDTRSLQQEVWDRRSATRDLEIAAVQQEIWRSPQCNKRSRDCCSTARDLEIAAVQQEIFRSPQCNKKSGDHRCAARYLEISAVQHERSPQCSKRSRDRHTVMRGLEIAALQ